MPPATRHVHPDAQPSTARVQLAYHHGVLETARKRSHERASCRQRTPAKAGCRLQGRALGSCSEATVVRGFFPRSAPAHPRATISRSMVHRVTSWLCARKVQPHLVGTEPHPELVVPDHKYVTSTSTAVAHRCCANTVARIERSVAWYLLTLDAEAPNPPTQVALARYRQAACSTVPGRTVRTQSQVSLHAR